MIITVFFKQITFRFVRIKPRPLVRVSCVLRHWQSLVTRRRLEEAQSQHGELKPIIITSFYTVHHTRRVYAKKRYHGATTVQSVNNDEGEMCICALDYIC